MNRNYKDSANTFMRVVLCVLIALLLTALVAIIKITMLKHALNNLVDKPTVYAASPNTIKVPSIFIYKLPEPVIPEEEPVVATAVLKSDQVILSRGGSGIPKTKQLTEKEQIQQYVRDICAKYDNRVRPELVMSMIEHESNYNPKAKVGSCLGLMQVSSKWHASRAARLGVSNFYDPYSNVLLGVDYLNELLTQYKDVRLVLMLYNMNHNDAISMFRQGKISGYAKSVISKSENYK